MADYKNLVNELSRLSTEQVNPRTIDIDRLAPLEIVRRINDEDKFVAGVVAKALEPLARSAELFAATLSRGGRVFYIGAGTSGRLGVLDAAECPPTFGTDPDQIIGVISGGYDTLVLSKEGVEDDMVAAVTDLQAHNLTKNDLAIGLAASKRTPYTNAGLRYARTVGAGTVFIVCNDADVSTSEVDILVTLPVGAEAITGSTRMKSGTAQKMALNIISTTAMVLLGKTYGNLMVDLQAKSEKLRARSRMILVNLLQIEIEQANELLEKAGGAVKTALVMHKLSCTREQALRRLKESDGFLHRVFEDPNEEV